VVRIELLNDDQVRSQNIFNPRKIVLAA